MAAHMSVVIYKLDRMVECGHKPHHLQTLAYNNYCTTISILLYLVMSTITDGGTHVSGDLQTIDRMVECGHNPHHLQTLAYNNYCTTISILLVLHVLIVMSTITDGGTHVSGDLQTRS